MKTFRVFRGLLRSVVWTLKVLIPCTLLFGTGPKALAWFPQAVITTNPATGEVNTNFSVSAFAAGRRAHYAQPPTAVSLKLHNLWWDIKDYSCYGFPYFLKHEHRALFFSTAGLLVSVTIILRSLYKSQNRRNVVASPTLRHKTQRSELAKV